MDHADAKVDISTWPVGKQIVICGDLVQQYFTTQDGKSFCTKDRIAKVSSGTFTMDGDGISFDTSHYFSV